MRIAIVGGGKRCLRLMKIIQDHEFEEITPEVVAVADSRPDAPGRVKAEKGGLLVTDDYNVFFDRDDIDLIIELTGNLDLYNDILKKKRSDVRAISDRTAQLFWEIARIAAQNQKARQQFKDARRMYETAINKLIQEDVLAIGRDYRIIDVNETLLKKLGLKREEVIGRTCYEVTHHQDHPCSGELHPCPLKNTLETRKPSETTHVHLDKEGREIYYSIHTYPMFENDHLAGAIEISRDITRDINLQKAVMQQEKLASVGRLSAGVAHEINNPLTTILTSAILIQEDTDKDDPIYEELETIANETLRCRKIVKSLLDFARQSKPTKKPCDPNELIRESILLTQKQAAFNDIAIEAAYDEAMPPLTIDRGQIQQALINLILNAVEATPSGGKIKVTTRFDPPRQQAYIEICDNGSGIPPAEMDKIFDPFFTTRDTGTGLGLAITHGIVEQHNGAIDVCSQIDFGTQFTIQLPTGAPSAERQES